MFEEDTPETIGSSPRVWGTPPLMLVVKGGRRFIPACVGNSICQDHSGRRLAVHPRVCGELMTNKLAVPASNGSSPRVWGTRQCRRVSSCLLRFIPACVGNSYRRHLECTIYAVHPRVCGELGTLSIGLPRTCGSSPRVWGTPADYTVVRDLSRFIPACVGNSCFGRSMRPSGRVHPRVCGELSVRPIFSIMDIGSSPRVWGTLVNRPVMLFQMRFIPACVGNSSPARSKLSSRTVHPRVCGEL